MQVVLKETGDVDMVGVWSADEKTLIAIVHSDSLIYLVPSYVNEGKWRWIMEHLPIRMTWTMVSFNKEEDDNE